MRTLKSWTPCDDRDPITGQFYCPYMDQSGDVNCEYWCGAGSDEDYVPEELIFECYDM